MAAGQPAVLSAAAGERRIQKLMRAGIRQRGEGLDQRSDGDRPIQIAPPRLDDPSSRGLNHHVRQRGIARWSGRIVRLARNGGARAPLGGYCRRRHKYGGDDFTNSTFQIPHSKLHRYRRSLYVTVCAIVAPRSRTMLVADSTRDNV